MAYDPADLKLPPWLLSLLSTLVRLRLPVTPGWSLGMTRPGVMFTAAQTGIWAAAFYSANNLLYLCGAMLLVVMLAAITQALWLLKSFPVLQGALPVLEAGQATVLRQPLRIADAAGLNVSAMVDISGDYTGGAIMLSGRCVSRANPALYPQITSQNPCTWVRPRRGAQIMVVPLASAATLVWPMCKGSLRASRPAAICGVALSCNGTTIASIARLAYSRRATRCGAICG